ncbi:hypothetical protein [Cohnella lupini]|uniref:Conjugative transposon protein TcpC n=1 Tax=Cohnella lupini TaxID=1294267 RepID=A0A3D9HNT7_9BACL|nr:hypothetical protein [Cohnella lupini]RED51173.1 hypothetical protein DFP95_1446 [Cohnella lupini]
MIKKITPTLLLSLLFLQFLTACVSESNNPTTTNTSTTAMTPLPSDISEDERAEELPEPELTPVPVPIPEPESVPDKVSLLPDEIYYYEGDEHMDAIGDTGESASFKKDPNLPYGFYIFDTMEEYVLVDGTEWGMDNQRRLFSLFDEDKVPFTFNYTNASLTQYEEYAGTDKTELGSYYDFFRFNDRGHKLVIRLHYFEEEKETTLPMFLDIVSSMRFVADPREFQPGVEIDFPEGIDEDEEAVIQLVKKNVESIASKNVAAFKSTLTPAAYDYLGFVIDTERQYRFTKLVTIEPYDETTGRKNLNIQFEYLEDGIVKQSSYTFTSLKNKDGKWEIANID